MTCKANITFRQKWPPIITTFNQLQLRVETTGVYGKSTAPFLRGSGCKTTHGNNAREECSGLGRNIVHAKGKPNLNLSHSPNATLTPTPKSKVWKVLNKVKKKLVPWIEMCNQSLLQKCKALRWGEPKTIGTEDVKHVHYVTGATPLEWQTDHFIRTASWEAVQWNKFWNKKIHGWFRSHFHLEWSHKETCWYVWWLQGAPMTLPVTVLGLAMRKHC